MAARVVAFINYKGGVAKTTTTHHTVPRADLQPFGGTRGAS